MRRHGRRATDVRRELLGAALLVAFVGVLLTAPISTTDRWQALAVAGAAVAIQTFLYVRKDWQDSATLAASIDVLSSVGIAVVAPDLLLLSAGFVLLAVVRATAVGGDRAGATVFILGEAALGLVALLLVDHGTPWLPFAAVAHPLLGAFALATVSTAVEDRDQLHASLNRLDEALSRFSDAMAVEATPHDAVAAALGTLLPEATLHRLTVGSTELQESDDEFTAAMARESGTSPLVRLRRAHRNRLVAMVAVPMRAGDSVCGALTLELPHLPGPQELRLLDVLSDRISVALVAESAHERERAARLELETAEQLRDEVLARVTHDLRAPLSTITGTVFTLREYKDRLSESDIDRMYGLLSRNADRVTNWVQSLLEGAVMGEVADVAPVPTPLSQLLTDGIETASELTSDHHVRVDAPDVTVDGDATATTRVVVNLLGNAAKYAPPGSVIEVTGKVHGDDVTIAVADHGPGMDPETAAHVFEPFFRAKSQPAGVHGTGLGLATVRQLVLSWGGRVGVSETPGGGATFWFTLPISTTTVLDLDAADDEQDRARPSDAR